MGFLEEVALRSGSQVSGLDLKWDTVSGKGLRARRPSKHARWAARSPCLPYSGVVLTLPLSSPACGTRFFTSSSGPQEKWPSSPLLLVPFLLPRPLPPLSPHLSSTLPSGPHSTVHGPHIQGILANCPSYLFQPPSILVGIR